MLAQVLPFVLLHKSRTDKKKKHNKPADLFAIGTANPHSQRNRNSTYFRNGVLFLCLVKIAQFVLPRHHAPARPSLNPQTRLVSDLEFVG